MRCEEARRLVSARLDGDEVGAHVDEHVAGCAACTGYLAALSQVRRRLRYEPAERIPDVTSRVMEAVAPRRPAFNPWLVPAAALAAGLVIGAVVIGAGGDRGSVSLAAPLSERVAESQAGVETLAATIEVVERGWHPAVPVRTYTGRLSYQAPETLWLELSDQTAYPGPDWVRNDLEVVAGESVWWSRGPALCPAEALPACTPAAPRVQAVRNREPFPDSAPAPLDLIVPVASFRGANEVTRLDGPPPIERSAVGAAVTAAQAAPLLDGLLGIGNWRELHPTDRVELWLDEDFLVPLAIDVYPGAGEDREAWAARRGYVDPAGVALLEVRVRNLEVNGEVPLELPAPPVGVAVRDAGFRSGEGSAPDRNLVPSRLPEGLEPHRSGVVELPGAPLVAVASWSDGRAWLKVKSATGWEGPGVFGNLGGLVRRVGLGAGVAYVSEAGDRVYLHGVGMEVMVTGSLATEDLFETAASLGLEGTTVPGSWPEAATATIFEARTALPGILVVPGFAGYGEAAIRVDEGTVTLGYAGAGDRGFRLTQRLGEVLSPPFGADVRGVGVRGTVGRYTPSLGELEWVEEGIIVSLRSTTVGLGELVAIAEALAVP